MVHCYCILRYIPHFSTTYSCTLLQSTQLCYSPLFNPLFSTLTKCISPFLTSPLLLIHTSSILLLLFLHLPYCSSQSLSQYISLLPGVNLTLCLLFHLSSSLSHFISMPLSPQALTWVTTRSVADRSWYDLAALADTCRSAWTPRRTGRPTHCLSGCITQHPWKKY